MSRRLPQIFFLLSIASLVLILGALWQASTPTWKTYQRQFLQLEAQGEPNAAAKAAVLATPPRIHQMMPHIPSRFGCTICHGGQGLATTKETAHGNVRFWPNPLLAREYIRASCGRCHKEGEVPGVPELSEARHLFETQGCRGCHKLNGVGGSIGADLTQEGANHRSSDWLEKHFLAPAVLSAGSAMPNFHFTREQAKALTYYMLSLANEEMGTYYSSVRLIPSAQFGRQLFVEKNCIACHSVGGVGSRSGPHLLGVTHATRWNGWTSNSSTRNSSTPAVRCPNTISKPMPVKL